MAPFFGLSRWLRPRSARTSRRPVDRVIARLAPLLRIEELEDRTLLSSNGANAGQVFDLSASRDTGALYLRQTNSVIEGQRFGTTGAWTPLVNVSTLPAGSAVTIDTAAVASAFSVGADDVPGEFIVYSSIFTNGRDLTLSSRGGIEVGENLILSTNAQAFVNVGGPVTYSGPAGNLTLVADNPPGALYSASTPQIDLKPGARLLADVGTTPGDVSLRVDAKQISLNVPFLTNFGVDIQTAGIDVGEGVTIRGRNVTLKAFAGDENPIDAVTKMLGDHPQVAGLIKSALGYATDYLGLPVSVQMKSPGAGVNLAANSTISSTGTTTVSAEAIGDATGEAIYGFDTAIGVGASFAFTYAAPKATVALASGAKISAGGEVLVTSTATSIADGTARVTQNVGAGYLDAVSSKIAPFSGRRKLQLDQGDGGKIASAIYSSNPDRIQASAVIAVSRLTSTVTVSQGAEITAGSHVAIHALGKSTNSQVVETASYFDGRAGITVAFGLTQDIVTATVNGTITVTNPAASAGPQTFNPFLAVDFAASRIHFAADHGFQTGDPLTYSTTGEAIPGLEKDATYYAIRVDARTVALAASREQALAGQAITFAPYPTLTKGTLTLPITRVGETTNTVAYDFATGLAAGDIVTYHAVAGAAIGGLVDGATYTVVAGGDPANANAFQLRDSSGNVVRLSVSPRLTWDGNAVDVNVGHDANTLDLRKRAFTPSVTGNTIELGYAHGFVTGMKLAYYNGGAASTNIGGLTSGATYYAVVDPAQPTRLRLATDAAGTNIVPLASAGGGSAHAFYAAVASGDAVTYSGALGLTINGLISGTTYYAIVNPYDPGVIRLTTSQADALRARDAGQASYDAARQTVYQTLYQIAYDDWLYDHPGDTAGATTAGTTAGNDAVAAVIAARPELPKVWYAAGLASARRDDNSVIVLRLAVNSAVLAGTAHTLTPDVRGISILARLTTSDSGATRSGLGSEPTLRDALTMGEVAPALSGIFKNLAATGKALEAIEDNLPSGSESPDISVSGSFVVHSVQNVVQANIGATAVLQTRGDLAIAAEVVQKTNRSVEATVSKPADSTTSSAAAVAVGFGLYSNEASVTIADGARLDASGAMKFTSDVRYPFLFPTTAADAESAFTTDLLGSAGNLVNGKLGLDRFLFNAWSRTAVEAPDADLSVAGSLSVPVLTNRSLVTVGDVRINQDAAFRSTGQSLAVAATTSVVLVDMTGNFVITLSPEGLSRLVREGRSPFNFGTQSGDDGYGGSLYLAVGTNTTSATIANGAVIFVSDADAGMSLTADTSVVNVSLAATTGKAKSTGFAGTFAASVFKNRTTAQIAGGAIIQATTLDVDAHDSTVQVNLAGSFQLSSRKGFGFTVTTNVLDRETLAVIGANPRANETAASSSITLSGDLTVRARNTGAMVAVGVAAAVVAPDPVPQTKVGADGASAVQDGGTTATDAAKKGGSDVVSNATKQVSDNYGIGISGDVALNLVTNDTAWALLNEAEADVSTDPARRNVRAADVSVTATNRTGIGAFAGAVAMTVSADAQGNKAIAGSLSVNTISGDTRASVTGVRMDADSLTVDAQRLGVIAVLTAAGAGVVGADGLGVGGSVSINVLTDKLTAYLTNSHLALAGDLTVKSRNETLILSLAGGVGYGSKAGVGFAIAVNVVTGTNNAAIDTCVINQTTGGLTLSATTDNPGGASNSDGDARIVALTGTVGISTGGTGVAGMVGVNVITDQTNAYLKNSTYTNTNANPLTNGIVVQATDDSWIVSLGVSVALASSTSVGGALSVNVIANTAQAYLENTAVTASGDLSVLASNGATIGAAAVGVAGSSGGTAVAGSVSVNVVSNTTRAYIQSTTPTRQVVSAGGDVEVKATDASLIVGVGGGVGISLGGGGAGGGALNVNVISNQTSATIDGAEVNATGAGSTLTVAATESATIVGVTVGVAGATGTAVSGSIAVNVVSNQTTAAIRNHAMVQTGGDLQVVASDQARLVVITGAIAVSFGSSAVGVSVSVNTVANTTEAVIDDSSATSTSGLVRVTAGWDAPPTPLPTTFTLAKGKEGDTPTTIDLPSPRDDLQQNQVVAVSVSGGVANNAAVAGALPVNTIANTFTGRIRNATVIAAADVEVQVNDKSSIGDGALGLAVGNQAGGATVGSSNIANTLRAVVENATVTAGQMVIVHASEEAQIITVSLGLGVAGNFALGGSVGVNVIANEVNAHISADSTVQGILVDISATDKSSIYIGLGGVGLAAGSAAGAAVGSNTVTNTIKAYIDQSDVAATGGDVQVLATSKPVIGGGSVGGAGSLAATAVAGSILISTVKNTTLAYIADDGTHAVTADANVAVAALQDLELFVGSGGFSAAAGTAVGVANSTLVTDNDVEAYLGTFTTVDARANRGPYTAYTGKKDGDGTLQTENVYGVSVTSNSFQNILSLAVAGSGGAGAGVAGSATVEALNEKSVAYIDRGARVNLGTQNVNIRQGVNVHATNDTRAITGAGGVAGGGTAAGGAGIDVGSLVKVTRAYIADATVQSRSFAATAIDLDQNTIDFKQDHGWTTGQPVRYDNGGGTSIGNLSSGDTIYYVIVVNPTTIKLATSPANATARIAIDLTSAGTSTSQRVQSVTVGLGQVFGPAGVILAGDANSIDLGLPHGFSTGDAVVYDASGGGAITGLQPGRVYYAIVDSTQPTRLRLAATAVDAAADTAIPLTSTGTATLQTIRKADLGSPVTLTGAAVQLATDGNTITTSAPHGLITGQPILYSTGQMAPIGGLVDRQVYYAIVLTPITLRLARSFQDAQNGAAIALGDPSGAAQQFAPVVITSGFFTAANITPGPAGVGFTIDLGYNHGFHTGDLLAYDADTGPTAGGSPSGQLTSGQTYYAIVDSAHPTRVRLADDAQAATEGRGLAFSVSSGQSHTLDLALTSSPTFNASTGIDLAQNTIDLGYNHRFITGQPIVYRRNSSSVIGNLVDGTVYYVIRVANEPTRIRLADTPAAATAGTARDLTSAPTSPTQTLNPIRISSLTQPFGPSDVDYYGAQQDSIALDPGLLRDIAASIGGTPRVMYVNGGGEDIAGLQNGRTYYLIIDSPVPGRVRLSETPGTTANPPTQFVPLFSGGTSLAQQFRYVPDGPTISSFDPSAIVTDADASSIHFAAPHGFRNGDVVVYDAGTDTPIGGLQSGMTYYALVDAAHPDRLKLAATLQDQFAGSAVPLTSVGGGTFRHATLDLPRPFTPAAVVVASNAGNKITLGHDHGFASGQAVVYDTGGGDTIGGLKQGGLYYVLPDPTDARSFRLAATPGGTAILLTSRGNGLLQTFRPVTVPANDTTSAPVTVRARDNVRVGAESTESVLSISIAGAGGFTGPAIAGSLGVWVLNLTTSATIGTFADVLAGNNVLVSARDVDNTSLLTGSAAFSGTGAAGAAVGVPVIVKSTTASINSSATVDALANGAGVNADTGEFDVVYGDPVFDPATAVDLDTDWITLSYEHGFTDGQAVVYDAGAAGSTAMGGLSSGITYYVITDPTNRRRLRLAASKADATGTTKKWIDLTSKGSGVSHAIRAVGAVSPSIKNTAVTAPGLVSRRLATNRTTPVHGVSVTATSTDDVEQMVISGAAATGLAVPLSGAVHVLDSTTRAFIGQKSRVNTRSGANAAQSVQVASGSDYYHLGVAGAVGGAGGVAVGASIDVMVPTVRSLAFIDEGATVYAANDVTVEAHTEANVLTVVAGFAGGGTVGVGGSVAVLAVNTETRAFIGPKDPLTAVLSTVVRAANNVLLLATDNTSSLAVTGAGGLGLGAAGVGLSLPIVVFTKTTESYVGNKAVVEGKALGTSTMTVTDDVAPPVPQPFDPATAVNPTTDIITLGYDHGFQTGQEVFYDSGTGINIGGLLTGVTYYAIVTGPRSLKLAKTRELALAGTAIDLTLTATTGKQHTVRPGSDFRTRTARGVAVQARSSEDMLTVAVAGGGGLWAGIAGVVSVAVVNSTTRAFVEDADINVAALNSGLPGSTQAVNVAAVNATRVRTVAPTVAGGAGAFAGVVNVVYVNNKSQAYLGDQSTVNAAGDIAVTALSYKDFDIFSISLSGGAVALSASVSVITLGAALTDQGRTALQDPGDSSKSATDTVADGSSTSRVTGAMGGTQADPNASTTVSTSGDTQTTGNSNLVSSYVTGGTTVVTSHSGTSAADTIDGTTAPESGTAAFVGKNATVTAGGNVALFASETVQVNASSGGLSGGIAGLGGAVGVVTVNSLTNAYVDSNSVVRAGGDVTVSANYAGNAYLLVYTGTGGAAALGAQVGVINDNSVQKAYLNDNAEVRQADDVRVQATATRSVTTEVGGVSVAGVAVGGSGSTANAAGSTLAYVGVGAKVGQAADGTVASITVAATNASSATAKGFLVTAGVGALGISNFEAQITPTVEASIRRNAQVKVTTDVAVLATSTAVATVDNRGGGGGGISVTALLSDASIGGSTTALIGEGARITARNLTVEATTPQRTASSTTYLVSISLAGGGGSTTTATVGGPTLGGNVVALIGPPEGTAAGANPAQLDIANTTTVRAESTGNAVTDVTVGVGGVFAGTAGATVTATVEADTKSYLGQNTVIGTDTKKSGGLVVSAKSTDQATSSASVGTGSFFYSLRGMKSNAVVKPTIAAYLGDGVTARLGGNLDVTATSVRAEGHATAKSYGGGLVDVGAPEAIVTSTPRVSAYLAADSNVTVDGNATVQALGLSTPSSSTGPLTDFITSVDAVNDTITFPAHRLQTGDVVFYSKGDATTGIQVPTGSGNQDLPTTVGTGSATTDRLYRVLVVDDDTVRLGVQLNAGQAVDTGDLFTRGEGVDTDRNTIQFAIPHNLETGDAVRYRRGTDTASTVGLSANTTYFVRKIDDFTIKLFTTRADAEAAGRTFTVNNSTDVVTLTGHGFADGQAVTYLAPTSVELKSTFVNAQPQTDANNNITGFTPLATPDWTIYLPSHGFTTGQQVIYHTNGTPIGGLTDNTAYYVIKVNNDRFQLAATEPETHSRPGPNNTTLPPNPIHLTAATGAQNARHFLELPAIAGLTSGVTYYVSRIDTSTFKLKDATGAVVNLDTTGTYGTHLLLKDGMRLNTAAGTHQLTIDFSAASSPAGKDKLLASGGLSLRQLAPPPGTGQSSAYASGESGGGLAFSTPTATVTVSPTVKAYVAATRLVAGKDVTVASNAVGDLTATAENKGGGFITDNKSNATANFGTGDAKAASHAFVGTEGTSGDVTATGVVIQAGGTFTLSSGAALTTVVNASTRGGGFGAGLTAHGYANSNIDNATIVGDDAQITAGSIQITSVVDHITPSITTSAVGGGVFGQATAQSHFGITSTADVTIGGGTTRITGTNGVVVTARHAAFQRTPSNDARFTGIGPSDPRTIDANRLTARINAGAGATVVAGPPANSTYALDVRAENPSPAVDTSVLATNVQSVVWDANVTVNRSRDPELVIANDGTLKRISNLTVTSGTRTLTNVGDQVTGDTITVSDIADGPGAEVYFGAASGVSNSARTPRPLFTLVNTYSQVRIVNDYGATLYIGDIGVANSASAPKPKVTISTLTASDAFQFDIAGTVGPTAIVISQNPGQTGHDLYLTGVIDNPIGTTTITNTNGDIRRADDGLIRTNRLTLSATGSLGQSTDALGVELVRSKDAGGTLLTPSLAATATSGSAYLQLRGRKRDEDVTPMTVYVDRLTVGSNASVTLLSTVTDSLLGSFTPGKLQVVVTPDLSPALSNDYANRFPSDDGTTSALNPAVYATTTNTNTIAGTFDFRDRATPGSPGLTAGGNVRIVANQAANDPAIHLVGITRLSGDTSQLDVTLSGNVDLTDTSGLSLRIGTVQSTAASVRLTVPDLATTGQNLTLLANGTIQAATTVTLRVGDDLATTAGSRIAAGTSIGVQTDYGDADAGTGTTLTISGALASPVTDLVTGGDDDAIALHNANGINAGLATAIVRVDGGLGTNGLLVDDSADTAASDGGMTGTTVTGLGMGGSGVSYARVASVEVRLSQGGSAFHVYGTSVSTTILGGAGDDLVTVTSADSGPRDLSTVLGTLAVDAAGGNGNRLILDDSGSSASNTVTVTSTTVTGLAPVAVTYAATGGAFTNGAANDGIVLRGSDTAADTFNVQSTLAGSTTRIEAGGGDDVINVSSDAGTNTGDLNGILGTLTVEAGSGANRFVVSDLAAASGNASVTVTDSLLSGFAPADIHYSATGGTFTNGSTGDGITLIGSDAVGDRFNVRSTLQGSTTRIEGGGGDDVFTLSSDAPLTAGTLDGLLGRLTLEANGGTANRLIASDFGATGGNAAITLTDHSLTGFAPADLFYYATGGSFTNGATGDGILLRGGNLVDDVFLILGTLRGSTTKVEGNGGADRFQVGSDPTTDFGNLNAIQGRLRLDSGTNSAGARDEVYVNDRGYVDGGGQPIPANYTLSPTTLVTFGLTSAMHLDDPSLAAPSRPDFAGIDYDGTTEFLRLDGSDNVNVFDVKPSLATEYFIDGNLPVPGVPLFGGGDYLRLDTSGTLGRKLASTGLGAGVWTFTSSHRRVGFESIERFNHVAIIASTVDAGPGRVPWVVVRDAETGAVKFRVLAYEATFRGGVQTAIGDLNGDGLPDLAVAPATGHSPDVKLYSGAPDATGTYTAPLLATFPAYSVTDRSGMTLAIGDVNRDGAADLVTVTRSSSLVKVFDGQTLLTTRALIGNPFLAYDATFRGGTSVAVGDLNGDGYAEIVTVRSSRVATVVRAFSGQTLGLMRAFVAAGVAPLGGGTIALGDYNGDGRRDIILGAGPAWYPLVVVYDGSRLATVPAPPLLLRRMAGVTTFRGGVRVKAAPVNGGDPGFVERVYVLAEKVGTAQVYYFSLLTTDKLPGR